MTDCEKLDFFGEKLITKVRDYTLGDFDSIVRGKMKSDVARKLAEDVSSLDASAQNTLERVVCHMVDRALHNLLWMIDSNPELDVAYLADGQPTHMKTVSDGLAGELYSDDGWIAKYSRCRSPIL
jgi:hypothetical protein